MMNGILNRLREAEEKAALLFQTIENNGLIRSGITEKQLNTEIYQLAEEILGVKKYWHKRIVRAGKNTLLPYAENPPDLLLQADDILFLDFGPVFEDWEADFGRTYVIGHNERKKKLKKDTERAFFEGKAYLHSVVKGEALGMVFQEDVVVLQFGLIGNVKFQTDLFEDDLIA